MAFEDAAGFALGVAAGAGVFVERLRARLAAQLGDGHAVQDRVDAAVAAGVVAVADRFAGSFGGRGGQRRGAVEAREAALGEAARVADLDQQLGDRAGRQAAELVQRRAGGCDEQRRAAGDVALGGVEARDLRAVAVEHPQPQRGRRVPAAAAVATLQRGQPRADRLGVGQLVAQLQRQLGEQGLGLVEQVLAALEQRPALPVPEPQQLVLLVGAGLLPARLNARGSSGCASVSRAIRSESSVSDLPR